MFWNESKPLMWAMAIALLFSSSLFAEGTVPAAEAQGDVALSQDDQRRLGIETHLLTAVHYENERRAIASAVDVSPWLQLRAEALSARAASVASAAQAQRVKDLFDEDQSASAQENEAAVALHALDQVRYDTARRQLEAQWGGPMAALDERGLASRLALGEQALLRIDPLGWADGIPDWTRLRLPSLDGGQLAPPIATWRAPTVSPGSVLPAWYVLVKTPARWPTGLRTEVHLPSADAATSGTMIPQQAIVVVAGDAWAYVQKDETHFQRRKIDRHRAMLGGYFMVDTFAPEERVVVSGGSLLLAQGAGVSSEGED